MADLAEKKSGNTILRSLSRKPRIHWSEEDKKIASEKSQTETASSPIIEDAAERRNTASPTSSDSDPSLLERHDVMKAVRGEIAMWRAVITQALMDATSQSSKVEIQYEGRKAAVWLEGRNNDFHVVCRLAQMEPDYVRERSARALKNRKTAQMEQRLQEESKPPEATKTMEEMA